MFVSVLKKSSGDPKHSDLVFSQTVDHTPRSVFLSVESSGSGRLKWSGREGGGANSLLGERSLSFDPLAVL